MRSSPTTWKGARGRLPTAPNRPSQYSSTTTTVRYQGSSLNPPRGLQRVSQATSFSNASVSPYKEGLLSDRRAALARYSPWHPSTRSFINRRPLVFYVCLSRTPSSSLGVLLSFLTHAHTPTTTVRSSGAFLISNYTITGSRQDRQEQTSQSKWGASLCPTTMWLTPPTTPT